jgi:Zn finger protein HypA/HybF involved in hydrogenase expression
MVIGYSIWFVVLLVLRRVVLSLEGVQDLGFAVYPFQSRAFPVGLLWVQLFDMAFRTILIASVLAFGGRLGGVLSSAFPRAPRLEKLGFLATALGALIIGYYAYEVLIVPPLASQGVEWAYKVIFWVLAAGILALAAFELVQMISLVARRGSEVEGAEATSPAAQEGKASARTCKECDETLSSSDRYCPACGALAVESETQRERGAAIPLLTEPMKAEAVGPHATAAPHEEALKERVIRLTRSTAAGATAKHMLGQFLEIDREHEPYKALLVTFMSLPPDIRKVRVLGIPTSRPLEATALEVIRPDELETWDRMTIEGLVVLAEPSASTRGT